MGFQKLSLRVIYVMLILFLVGCNAPTITPQLSTPTQRIITAPSPLSTEAPGVASTSSWPPTPEPFSSGKIFIIKSVADNGSGSLRQAMLDARRGDLITFDPSMCGQVKVSLRAVAMLLKNSDLCRGDINLRVFSIPMGLKLKRPRGT